MQRFPDARFLEAARTTATRRDGEESSVASSTGGRYRDALRQRDFRLMVVAYIVDALGGWAYSVVLAVYVWDRTHSTQWLAAMASAGWLTSLLVGGYAGALVT